ncbi:serine/threonine protein kinase [Actinomadura parmotrematis]|uniref:Protein kinase n=1 Tax=Actinomadura parmotrematis TaxID=2864039 RepID=A0ABS7FP57_9ACTN|nr:serine/threonine-protein kinase [Actinomadura parmotrematis]MBW8482162.1 protein kinase [Actinomadura parmotrematis]
MPDAAPLEPGDPRALGRYEVVGRLGAGGQGAVFLGRPRGGGDYVAIKLLHPQMAADPAARARFTREVAAAQKVEPFCTARVLEADVEGNQPYVVSEFIDGPSLHDVVAHNGPFGAAELERLAIGTVTALAAIHEAGIVHRDFKPNNVMLASDGPRVVDFGIARTVNSQESAVTATGMVVGTPGYLAPEQLTGAALTPAVDIFAWAATMVFAGTGTSPFEAETLPVIINRILNEEPDLSALPAGQLRDLVGRCLSKDAGLRPTAAQLLLNLLNSAGAAPANAAGDSEELLNQGTRIAAQLPAPPPVPQARQGFAQGPPQAGPGQNPPPHMITPPPMAMNQGGYQPAYPQQGAGGFGGGPPTPPPVYQGAPGPYQGSPTGPPMPMNQGGYPSAGGPGFAPPLQRPPAPKSNTGLFVGLGCGLLALIVVIVVIILVIVGSKSDDPDPTPTGGYTYSPSSGASAPMTMSGGGLLGIYTGTGNQPGTSDVNARTFTPKFYLTGSTGSAFYYYSSSTHITCMTRLALLPSSSSDTRKIYRETAISSNASQCANGYVTFIITPGSSSLRWEWRQNSESDGSAEAYGTVSKQ